MFSKTRESTEYHLLRQWREGIEQAIPENLSSLSSKDSFNTINKQCGNLTCETFLISKTMLHEMAGPKLSRGIDVEKTTRLCIVFDYCMCLYSCTSLIGPHPPAPLDMYPIRILRFFTSTSFNVTVIDL